MILRAKRSMERGMVLVTALLMLIVVTLIALAMFRSFGLDEKMAGNLREKQRAVNAAETAEQYAEYWLANGGAASSVPIPCASVVGASLGQICLTAPSAPALMPWPAAVTYLPTAASAMNVASAPVQGSYYATPQFYITYLGTNATGQYYQIDAAAWGGSPDTMAVVESTYLVEQLIKSLSNPP
jgi:type IV pilus assembly protein PilX